MELFDLYGSVSLDDHASKPLEKVGKRFDDLADDVDKSEKKVSRFNRALRKLRPVGNLWGRMKGGHGPGGFGGRGSRAEANPPGGRKGPTTADVFRGAPLILGAMAVPLALMNKSAGAFDQALAGYGQTLRRATTYQKDYTDTQRKAMRELNKFGKIDTQRAAELARDIGASDVFTRPEVVKAFKTLADNQGLGSSEEALKAVLSNSIFNRHNYSEDPTAYNELEAFKKILGNLRLGEGGHETRAGIEIVADYINQRENAFKKASFADEMTKLNRAKLERDAVTENASRRKLVDPITGEFASENLLNKQLELHSLKTGISSGFDDAGKIAGQAFIGAVDFALDNMLVNTATGGKGKKIADAITGGAFSVTEKKRTVADYIPGRKDPPRQSLVEQRKPVPKQLHRQIVPVGKPSGDMSEILGDLRESMLRNPGFKPEGGQSYGEYTEKDINSLALQAGAKIKKDGLASTNNEVLQLLQRRELFAGTLDTNRLKGLMESNNKDIRLAYSGLIEKYQSSGTPERVINNNRDREFTHTINNNRDREFTHTINNNRYNDIRSHKERVVNNREIRTDKETTNIEVPDSSQDYFTVPPSIDLTETNFILSNIYALLKGARGELIGAATNISIKNSNSVNNSGGSVNSVVKQLEGLLRKNPQTGF